MSIIYVCDSCRIQSDDGVKVYEFSDEAKKFTGLNEYDYLCAECLKYLNVDKELCVVKGIIKVKDKKYDKRTKATKPSE
ncbi:hypothetical protein G5B97_00600 [Campylobacter concisus]|uniref:hypothetical protein n=1 Tax=Campylobacter concisus TaxID=199 RepID=UPI0018AA93DA|nr:hypothetical protein [Campylobacter concisus]QPI00464.1 hypothetical protein G5B97_00600 [Campylobacter concisus]